MLASRPSTEEVIKIISTRAYQTETKYDGERVQVHKQGKNIKLFSRNSNDITEIYGAQLKVKIRSKSARYLFLLTAA